jgi:ADP-ribose pyrophosphatase YjhB (NUDIX family)
MHAIRYHILKRLSLSPRATYSELKPIAVQSNAFAYHLKTLKQEGLLTEKLSGKESKKWYGLSHKGKLYVDKISFDLGGERIQPKIVNLLVIKKGKSEYLFYTRTRAPFVNHVGFPYGKIHLEERIHDAALRELCEKTGLNIPLAHVGDTYIAVHDETELVSHMLCHIFLGNVQVKNGLGTKIKPGCFWSHIDEIPVIKRIPGVTQIEKIIRGLPKSKPERFFKEFFLNTSEE